MIKSSHLGAFRKCAKAAGTAFLALSIVGCSAGASGGKAPAKRGTKTQETAKKTKSSAKMQDELAKETKKFFSCLKKGDQKGAKKLVDNTDYSRFGFFGAPPGICFLASGHTEKMNKKFKSFRKSFLYPNQFSWKKIKSGKNELRIRVSQKRYCDVDWTWKGYQLIYQEAMKAMEKKHGKDEEKALEPYAGEIMSTFKKQANSVGSDEYDVVITGGKNGRLHMRRVATDSDLEVNNDSIKGASLTGTMEMLYVESSLGQNLSSDSPEAKSQFDYGMYLIDYRIKNGGQTVEDRENLDFTKNVSVEMQTFAYSGCLKPVAMAFRDENDEIIFKKEFSEKEAVTTRFGTTGETAEIYSMTLTPEQLSRSDYFKVTLTHTDSVDEYGQDAYIGYVDFKNEIMTDIF